jgi:hypothetical protein
MVLMKVAVSRNDDPDWVDLSLTPTKTSSSWLHMYFSGTLQTGRPGFDPRKRQRIVPLASVSRPALRPTQPPIHWVPRLNCFRGVTLITHPHPVPRWRMITNDTPLPHGFCMAWRDTFALLLHVRPFASSTLKNCLFCVDLRSWLLED